MMDHIAIFFNQFSIWNKGECIGTNINMNSATLCKSIIKQIMGRYVTKKVRITLYYGDCPQLGHFIQFKVKKGQTYYTLCRNHQGKIRGKMLFNPATLNEKLSYIFREGKSPICTFTADKIGWE